MNGQKRLFAPAAYSSRVRSTRPAVRSQRPAGSYSTCRKSHLAVWLDNITATNFNRVSYGPVLSTVLSKPIDKLQLKTIIAAIYWNASMKQSSFLIGLVAATISTASFAADMSERAYTKAPAYIAPTSNWTGAYIGAQVGARWSNSTWTTTALEDPVSNIDPFASGGNPSSFNSTTFKGGGYAGYNYQFAPSWVVGLEGDINWGDGKRTAAGIPGAYTLTLPRAALDSTTVKQGWDASIRARLGFLVTPSTMLFGTAGVAWQDASLNTSCSSAGLWCVEDRNETFNTVKTGWTVGGGLETKVWTNWLARVEYRYADYGTIDHEFFPATIDAVFMHETLKTHTVSVGLAYQFGGPAH